jgi:hypothetical protein
VKPLIPESQIENKRQQLPWKKRERDKVLNLYFAGTTPDRIAIRIGRNPKAVERLIQEYRYNERNKAVRYEPRRRKSRKGNRMTKNEWLFVKSHDKRNIPREVTARLLARAPGEILVHELDKDRKSKEVVKIETQLKFNFIKPAAVSLDQLIAHIYLRRFAHCKILSDKEYDSAKAEEIEFAGAKAKIEQAENWPHVCDFPRTFGIWHSICNTSSTRPPASGGPNECPTTTCYMRKPITRKQRSAGRSGRRRCARANERVH